MTVVIRVSQLFSQIAEIYPAFHSEHVVACVFHLALTVFIIRRVV